MQLAIPLCIACFSLLLAAADMQPAQPEILAPESVLANHPLKPAVDLAVSAREKTAGIKDYSCTLAKREHIDGRLSELDYLFLKIRNEPFSVYLYCLGPVKPKGQEAIYVEGRNSGLALAHTTGIRNAIAGTMSLEPTSALMMEGNRYPITNIGMRNLLEKVSKLYLWETRFGECQVKIIDGAKVDDRVCQCVEVVHPVRRRDFKFHKTRAYFDRERRLLIRWEAYEWPEKPGGEPPLVEEYTYRNIKLNVGLADLDFDVSNPAYEFQ